MLLSVRPWCKRVALLPQTGSASLGSGLCGSVPLAFDRLQIAVVAGEVPGQSVCYQLQADVDVGDENKGDQAIMDIGLDDGQSHLASFDGLFQGAPRYAGPGLEALGRIDAGQAHLDDPAAAGAHAE